MASLNCVHLIGNVGKEPEIRTTQSGSEVASLSLAVTERFKDKNGQMQEKTEWFNLVAWRKQSEIIKSYVKKGSSLYVQGKLQTQSWDDPNGQKRYKTEILISNFQILGSKQVNTHSSPDMPALPDEPPF